MAITLVSINIVCACSIEHESTFTWARTYLQTHGIGYHGVMIKLQKPYYICFYTDYYHNPYTGEDWTEDEVSNLIAGVSLFRSPFQPQYKACCSQVFVFVKRSGIPVQIYRPYMTVQQWAMAYSGGDSVKDCIDDIVCDLWLTYCYSVNWLGGEWARWQGTFIPGLGVPTGYIWVENEGLHYISELLNEREIVGELVGYFGNPGQVMCGKTLGTYFYYIDESGNLRKFEGTKEGVTGKLAGQMSINTARGGSKFCYIDDQGDERTKEGSLVG